MAGFVERLTALQLDDIGIYCRIVTALNKLEKGGFLTCEARTVDHKQRKYYRITPAGMALLNQMKQKIEELYEEVVKEQ
jgi:DNA-binding PadR family transcriptional regulator